MKKLFYTLILAVIITACGKDDNPTPPIDPKLVGTWELEYYYQDTANNPIEFDNAETYTRYDAELHSIEFNADTACGRIEIYSCAKMTCSYYTHQNQIISIESCSWWDNGYCYINYFIGNNVNYKFKNNQLIIASNSQNITSQRCVSYGYYKRIE